DRDRRRRDLVSLEVGGLDPFDRGSVGAARGDRRRAGADAAGVVDDDVVVFGPAVRIETDAVEDLDDRSDLDVEARLLTHLARERCLQGLARLDRSPRQAPLPLERLLAARDEQHTRTLDDD